MASTAAVLNIIVSANTSQATAALARTDKQLKGTAASGTAASAAATKLGTAAKYAAVGGVAALAYGVYKSVKASVDFEEAFAEVRKTVDGSEADFAKLERGIRTMAQEIPVGAEELARMAGQAGALGIAKGDLLAFTRVAADLGVTTDLSSDEAANALARLGNIMGATSGDYSRMGSALVDLGNKGASTESEISDMALRLAGVGKQVGLNTSQVLGWSSAMANVGIEAESGGSSLSRAFIEMQNAASKGGAELQLFAQTAGVAVPQFTKMIRTDASGAMIQFVEGLGKIRKSGGDVFAVLEQLGLSEIRVRRTLLSLAGNSKEAAKALGISDDAWKDNTALMDEAEKRYETTAGKIDILKNRFHELAITIGDELSPALNDAIDGMLELTAPSNAPGDKGGGGIGQDIKDIIAGLDIPKVADSLFGDPVAMAKNFFSDFGGAARGAIQSLAGGIKGDWGHMWDGLKATAKDAITGAFNVTDAFSGGQISGAINTAKAAFNKVKGLASGGAKIALSVGGDVVGQAKAQWNRVKSVVSGAINIALSVGGDVVGKARDLWNKVKGAVSKGIALVIDLPAVDFLADKARSIWDAINSALPDISINIDIPTPDVPDLPWKASGDRDFQGGLAMVNERGPEMAEMPNGALQMLAGGKRNAMVNLPKHAVIYTASETRRLLAAGLPGFKDGKKGKNKKPKKKAVAPTGNMWEAALAAAELTDDTADDVAALTNLITYWKGQESFFSVPRKGGKGTKGTAMAWDKLAAARQAIKTYQDQLADLTGGPSGNELAAMTEMADLYKQMASTNAQRFAVSQSQYATLQGGLPPFGGTFHDGGIVPGPIGAEKLILAQGGESVSPAGAGAVTVIVHDGAVDASKIEVIAGNAAQNAMRKSARTGARILPSGGG